MRHLFQLGEQVSHMKMVSHGPFGRMIEPWSRLRDSVLENMSEEMR